MSTAVTFARPDGKSAAGYRIPAAGTKRNVGIVLIQEWWGVNEQIQGVAARLSAAGYEVLIPDLYAGKVTLESAEAAHLMDDLDFGDAASQTVRGATTELKRTVDKVAVMGFCMGGAVTVLSLSLVPELDAAVSWYGTPPASVLEMANVKAPLLGHWALDDASFPIEMVDELENALEKAGKTFEFYRYDAKHAFGNENNPQYDAEKTQLAWQRSLEFIAKYLG